MASAAGSADSSSGGQHGNNSTAVWCKIVLVKETSFNRSARLFNCLLSWSQALQAERAGAKPKAKGAPLAVRPEHWAAAKSASAPVEYVTIYTLGAAGVRDCCSSAGLL